MQRLHIRKEWLSDRQLVNAVVGKVSLWGAHSALAGSGGIQPERGEDAGCGGVVKERLCTLEF